MEIKDKVVLITGARRIGGAVALDLARAGAHIILFWRTSSAEIEALEAEIKRGGGRVCSFQCDVSDPAAVERSVAQASEVWGGLDILINLASVFLKREFNGLGLTDWHDALDVDARGTYLMSLAAAPALRRAGGARIINFTDWVAPSRRPRYKGYTPYYAAKSAVLALTESMALEMAEDQVLVNAIAPGPVLPAPDLDPEEYQRVVEQTPLGRWGGEAEIVKAVRFLIDTDFVTGECIRVDGGRHLK